MGLESLDMKIYLDLQAIRGIIHQMDQNGRKREEQV